MDDQLHNKEHRGKRPLERCERQDKECHDKVDANPIENAARERMPVEHWEIPTRGYIDGCDCERNHEMECEAQSGDPAPRKGL